MRAPSDNSVAALRHALLDHDTVERYKAKIRRVDGSSCEWWVGAVTAQGHGRFWLADHGTERRDIAVIAHRFGYALTFGIEALQSAELLGHRCDNPLCQRADAGHVQESTAQLNRVEYERRRHTIGGPLRDRRGARQRALEIRDALRAGRSVEAARLAGILADMNQLALFDT